MARKKRKTRERQRQKGMQARNAREDVKQPRHEDK